MPTKYTTHLRRKADYFLLPQPFKLSKQDSIQFEKYTAIPGVLAETEQSDQKV